MQVGILVLGISVSRSIQLQVVDLGSISSEKIHTLWMSCGGSGKWGSICIGRTTAQNHKQGPCTGSTTTSITTRHAANAVQMYHCMSEECWLAWTSSRSNHLVMILGSSIFTTWTNTQNCSHASQEQQDAQHIRGYYLGYHVGRRGHPVTGGSCSFEISSKCPTKDNWSWMQTRFLIISIIQHCKSYRIKTS